MTKKTPEQRLHEFDITTKTDPLKLLAVMALGAEMQGEALENVWRKAGDRWRARQKQFEEWRAEAVAAENAWREASELWTTRQKQLDEWRAKAVAAGVAWLP